MKTIASFTINHLDLLPGLYLSRRVTEKLGHDLTIVSRPGRGTIARLDLSRRKRTME